MAAEAVRFLVYDGPDGAVEALARYMAGRLAGLALAAPGGRVRVALPGGSTPRRLFARMVAPDLVGSVPWSALELAPGDERFVPAGHPARNDVLLREALIDRLPVAPAALFEVPEAASPELAAAAFGRRLGDLPFDWVLLGMGSDGHVASLFPGDDGLAATTIATAARAPVEPKERVSLTFTALAAAGERVLLVLGEDKAEALARVRRQLAEPPSADHLPAARLRPALWFVDRAAFGVQP